MGLHQHHQRTVSPAKVSIPLPKLPRVQNFVDIERLQRRFIVYTGACTAQTELPDPLYQFHHMNRMHNCTIDHFQLRHLLWTVASSSVYFPSENRVWCWDPIRQETRQVAELGAAGIPFWHLSTMCASRDWMLAGGFDGELVFRRENEHPAIRHRILSEDANNIVNHMQPLDDSHVLISANDMAVRIMDLNTFQVAESFALPWPVNASQRSVDHRLVCAVGDGSESILFDTRTQRQTLVLHGHVDFSFSCSWSLDGHYLATANQDHTVRVYDMRMSTATLHVIASKMVAVRNVAFSPDGATLAVADADDFVQLLDVRSGFCYSQTVDFFGQVAGVGWTPDSESLYIGVSETGKGGVIELSRRHDGLYNKISGSAP